MPFTLDAAAKLDDAALLALSPEDKQKLVQEVFGGLARDYQEAHLLYYQPVSETARQIHFSTAQEVIASGGNRSSKTDTLLAELAIQMTGIVPHALAADYPKDKLRPPIRARVVCQSLTNTLVPVILPKLQWWVWNGRECCRKGSCGKPGAPHGHWGWIPRHLLLGGDWAKSWSEKQRTLTLTSGTTCAFMSYDQEVQDFSGTSLHVVLHDEGPPHSIYRENKLRVLDVAGRLYTAMTPPDEESAAWDAAWVYDELYEKGLPGPAKDPAIDAFTLFTEDNRILDPADIQAVSKGLTPTQREVRLRGRFLHLTGRIYPTYTDREQWWCFHCNTIVLADRGKCATCEATDVVAFSHFVEPFDIPVAWPVVYVLDPHPRKPHAMAWYAVDPADDVWQVAELQVDGEPATVKERVDQLEREQRLGTVKRLMDPNMGASPSGGRRGVTVRDEFDAVGLRCDLADDNRDTARSRLREMQKPDPRTRAPRFRVFRTCPVTNHQFLRWTWDSWSRYSEQKRDPKPVPIDKYSDFPTCAGYLMNSNPTFAGLRMGGQRMVRSGTRRGGY